MPHMDKGQGCRLNPEVITVVRDDAPGHDGGVEGSNHPEHAEPAQMLPSLLTRQEFGEIGKDNGESPSNSEEAGEVGEQAGRMKTRPKHCS